MHTTLTPIARDTAADIIKHLDYLDTALVNGGAVRWTLGSRDVADGGWMWEIIIATPKGSRRFEAKYIGDLIRSVLLQYPEDNS